MTSTPRTPKSSVRAPSRHDDIEASFPTPPTDVFPSPSIRVRGRSSPAPKKLLELKRAASTPPEFPHENRPMSSRRPAEELLSASSLAQSWNRQQLSKKRSQYYDGAFAYREVCNTAKDRVARDSLVLAEVKLNCFLETEQSFLGDLSFQLSEIYQRPESCIMVIVSPETPILLGGNSEPAYHITLTALASEVAPTKNKRSTYLIQKFMTDCLRIPANRGVIRFEALAEENLATNGMTTLQEIEELQRNSSEDSGALRTVSRNRSRKGRKMSMPLFTERGRTPVPPTDFVTPVKSGSRDTGDSRSIEVSGTGWKKLKHRRSIMAFFGR